MPKLIKGVIHHLPLKNIMMKLPKVWKEYWLLILESDLYTGQSLLHRNSIWFLVTFDVIWKERNKPTQSNMFILTHLKHSHVIIVGELLHTQGINTGSSIICWFFRRGEIRHLILIVLLSLYTLEILGRRNQPQGLEIPVLPTPLGRRNQPQGWEIPVLPTIYSK